MRRKAYFREEGICCRARKASGLAKARERWVIFCREPQSEVYIGARSRASTNDDGESFNEVTRLQNRPGPAGLRSHSGGPIGSRVAARTKGGAGLEFDRHDWRPAATQFHDDAGL